MGKEKEKPLFRKAKNMQRISKKVGTIIRQNASNAAHFAARSSSAHSPDFLSHARTYTAPLTPLTPTPTATRTAHFSTATRTAHFATRTAHFVRHFKCFHYYTMLWFARRFRMATSFSVHYVLRRFSGCVGVGREKYHRLMNLRAL